MDISAHHSESQRGSQMSKRRRKPNPNKVKIHRNYSLHEIARLFKTSLATVRRWLKAGLKTIDLTRPFLVRGMELKRFVRRWRSRNRRRCGPGQLYCLKCRAPRWPSHGEVELIKDTENCGRIRGVCSACGASICRIVSFGRLDAALGPLTATTTSAERRLSDRGFPGLNDYIEGVK
jgi:hypothetical protein